MLKIIILIGMWLAILYVIAKVTIDIICMMKPRIHHRIRRLRRRHKKMIRFCSTVYALWAFTGIIGVIVIQLL